MGLSALSKLQNLTHYDQRPVLVRSLEGGQRAKHYHYSLKLISFSYQLSCLGLGYRKVVEVLRLIKEHLLPIGDLPAYTSVRDWVLKIDQGALVPRVQEQLKGRYALISDISMSLGKRRLLVFLALDLANWTFDRPLILEDVEVAGLFIKPTFKGEDVAFCLEQVMSQHPKMEIAYVVSDQGESLSTDTTTLRSPVLAAVFGQAGLQIGATVEGTKYTRIIP